MQIGEKFNPFKVFVGLFIPNALAKYKGLSALAKLCWGRLAQYAGHNGVCYPSQDIMATEIGVSGRTVRRALKELESKKFISITSPTGTERYKHFNNSYIFLWHGCFEGEVDVHCGQDKSAHSLQDKSAHSAKANSAHSSKENHLREPLERESLEKDPPTPHRGNGKVGSFRSSIIANLFTTQFWPAYPRKESKGRAIKAFNAINPTAEMVAQMVKSLTFQKRTDKWLKDNGQYIPLPATWLNDIGWENEMRVEDAPGYDSADDPNSPDYEDCNDKYCNFNPLTGKDEFHTITEWRKMGFKESGFWIDKENRRRTDDAPYNH